MLFSPVITLFAERNPVAGAGRRGQRLLLAAVSALFVTGGVAPALAQSVPLATFRSVHDLELDPSAPSGELLSVNARLVTEFTGSACKGYTDQTRFVMETTDRGGMKQLSDLRQLTTETAAGRFAFDAKAYNNSKLVEQAVGVAERAAGADTGVKLTKPAAKEFSISSKIIFPTELTQKTLAAARSGSRFMTSDLYSGDADGETVYATSIVIGKVSTEADFGDDAPFAETPYATLPHWPVTVAYFEKKPGSGGTSPLYVTFYMLYDNGMVGQLKIMYPDFTLVGTLTSMETLPAAPCP